MVTSIGAGTSRFITRVFTIALILSLIVPGTICSSGGEIEGESIVNMLEMVPIYGHVMETAINMVFLFGGSQKSAVEKAVDRIKYALVELDKRIQNLDRVTKTLASELVRTQNQHRLTRYRDYSRQIQALAIEIGSKPSGLKQRKILVDKAAIYANALIDESEFNHFWEWTGVTQDGQVIAADFSPLPGFILYNSAMVVWIAALELYGDGNSDLIVEYAPALRTHAHFMSTLPEKVSEKISCDLGNYKYFAGSNGQWNCSAMPKCQDHFSKNLLEFPDLTMTIDVEEGDRLCGGVAEKVDGPGASFPAKRSIEAHYGVDSMVAWAALLERYATYGRFTEHIGRFESSPYPYLPVFVYSIAEDGSLQWRRHRPLPEEPKMDPNIYEDSNTRVTQLNKDPMRARTKVKISQPNLNAERIGTGQRITPSKQLPETRFDGPVSVKDGWGDYLEIFPAGGSAIYALTTTGDLVWYEHLGVSDGEQRWSGPNVVQQNFGNFRKIIPAGNGVLYVITQDDQLLWYKHNGVATGGGKETWSGPLTVGNGWAGFKHVFSGGDGVLFAVKQDGILLRYVHKAWNTGEAIWEGPRSIGNGWQNFQTIFSAGNGSIYAVNTDGSILWYRFTSNPDFWFGPATVATGVTDLRSMFAILPRDSIVVR